MPTEPSSLVTGVSRPSMARGQLSRETRRSTPGGGCFPGSDLPNHVLPSSWPQQHAQHVFQRKPHRVASPGAAAHPLAGGLTSAIRVPIGGTRQRRARADAERAAGPGHDTRRQQRELLAMEAHSGPARRPPPEHYHPRQEERFTGVGGTVAVRVAGVGRTIGPGDQLTIPQGSTTPSGIPEAKRRCSGGRFGWRSEPSRCRGPRGRRLDAPRRFRGAASQGVAPAGRQQFDARARRTPGAGCREHRMPPSDVIIGSAARGAGVAATARKAAWRAWRLYPTAARSRRRTPPRDVRHRGDVNGGASTFRRWPSWSPNGALTHLLPLGERPTPSLTSPFRWTNCSCLRARDRQTAGSPA